MNTINPVVKALFAGIVALALGACAAQPTEVAGKAPRKRDCVRDTGTHIKVKEGECAPVAGTVYTNEDLQRTGAQTLNEAVSRLRR